MRNRAKCKLCGSIIESVQDVDYVVCSCGEIAVSGGQATLECFANDFSNFMRVDDDGNEIVVQVKDKERPGRKELVEMLDEMARSIDKLPEHAKLGPITHYDLAAALMLLHAILKID